MSSISPRFMQELRDRLNLSEVVGRKVKLTRAGREYKACCPFHGEKSPSFYINDDKQFYHCFGCGAHGDAVGFVMQHDNLSFIEAVEVLAAQAGMEVPKQSMQEVEASKREKSLYALMDDTAKFFEKHLREVKTPDALRYLRERGLPDDIITAFRLGYSPADGQALRSHLKSLEYTDEQMIEAGVVRKSDQGREPYSFFRDRVMFPVADRRGRIVAFGGRVLPEHMRPIPEGGNKPPKYINSSETTLFHKGRMVYGESHARQAAADGQKIVVVEGYLDVIACFQAGFRGAVAPLGTALTDDQILNLWKMIPGEEKFPILCFDGDGAGQRAAVRAAENLLPHLKPNHSAKFAFLPAGQDPDSLVRSEGAKALGAVLDSAIPLVEFLWNHHTAGKALDTPELRAGLEKTLEDSTLRIADRSVQQYYKQAFRDRIFQVYGNTRRNDGNYQNKNNKFQKTSAPIALRRPGQSAGQGRAVMILLATAINHPEIVPDIDEDLGTLDITANQRLDELRQEVLRTVLNEPTLDSAALINHLKQAGYGAELEVLLSDSIYIHAGFAKPSAEYAAAIRGWRAFRERDAS
jgi:DNA primase